MDPVEFWSTCSVNGIVLSREQVAQFERYVNDLLYWNERVNLISRRDTEHIWTLVTHLLMFVTPVFYGLDTLSAPARFVIYWLNPLTPFLVALRGALIGPPAHVGVHLHALLIGGVVLIGGYAAFLSAESSAMERT